MFFANKAAIFLALIIGLNVAPLFAESKSPANGTIAYASTAMDDSWRLWLDPQAGWKQDALYLPDEVDLAKIPVHPPTVGWNMLNDQSGIPVTLPGTVEEYYWGKDPLPMAHPENPADVVGLNSPYVGVSWWYRSFVPPALKPGEHLVFSFPGARLRAEVYVNEQLVGYNLVGETPFAADVTDAIKPGQPNQLAVRITNNGGTFAWPDYDLQTWGNYQLPQTHGFGGIDGGITMSVRGPVTVDDLSVANHPDPHTVTLQAELVSTGPAYQGPLSLKITYQNKEVWHGTVEVNVPAHQRATVSKEVTVKNARLWGLQQPVLYQATAEIASIPHSGQARDFGFRWFNAEGLGENPRLALNGHRVFLSSAISWGYWAPNGLFPDQAAVQREIDAAQTLGLNCIQTHRHFPKAAVLDGFDHAGLLRYCEPGGGYAIWDERFGGSRAHYQGPIDTSGTNGEPTSFANRYEVAKILAMVKAYRSHPSVILWSLNNETDADLHNPKIFYALRKVHELDPSRIVLLKSSYGPGGEVLGLPYSTNLTYGDAATHHDSGWHDIHNEDDAGVYQDSLYKNPTDYKCFSDDTNGIAMWGELGTADSPDDDFATVKWYEQHLVPGYNRAAATARLKAYDAFLDKYQFRQAFPSTEDLFHAIGARHYFAAARIIENARISDANDYIAITGWESTTVDNNSGLVDALRHLKADPAPVRQANAPDLIVVRPRHYVVAKGDSAVVDTYVVNETNLSGPFVLHFSAAMDASKASPFFETAFPVRLLGGETFGQLLKDNIQFTVPEGGAVTLTASLTATGKSKPILQRTEPLLGVDPQPALITNRIACLDYNGKLLPALKRQFGANAVPFDPATTKVDTILVSSRGVPRSALNLNELQHFQNAANTDDPGLYAEQSVSKSGDLAWYQDLAIGKATVELFFVETYFDTTGIRLFDVALNGRTVLRNFDIGKEAGGKGKAVVKQFTVDCPNGKLTLSIPRVESDQPEIAAIRITDAQGKVIREVFRPKAYQSPTGEVWSAVKLGGFDWEKVLPEALSQVRTGARLVLLGSDAEDINQAAKVLARENILTSSGTAGFDDTPWLGHWYFCRKHWLLDGLPSNCVFDWQYQAGGAGNGFILDAPGMEPVVAYGKNPGPGLGFNAVVIPVGQGQIVLLGIAGLDTAFLDGNPNGFQPVTAKRIIYNAIRFSQKDGGLGQSQPAGQPDSARSFANSAMPARP